MHVVIMEWALQRLHCFQFADVPAGLHDVGTISIWVLSLSNGQEACLVEPLAQLVQSDPSTAASVLWLYMLSVR